LAMLFISIPNPAESNSIIKWSASLLFMRSIGNAGLMNSLYYEFFSKNPQTNFSHLNVVNYFFDSYPYGNLSLGQIIGVHYYKSDSMNANANFWATDGFASSGPTGVLFISVVLSLFFVSVNYFTRNTKTEYTAIYLLPVAVVMTDISFFTTLTSGGGLLLLLFVSFFKIPKS
jgi:hypothetical protein